MSVEQQRRQRAPHPSPRPERATSAAQQTATAALPTTTSRAAAAVATDTAGFVAGGTVSVTIGCHVDLADLAGLRLPASTTVTGTAVVLDRYLPRGLVVRRAHAVGSPRSVRKTGWSPRSSS